MQIEQLFDFLHRSVSPFHAVHTAAQLLDAAGYTRLEEAEYWNLEPEHGYYVTRNESSIIAWRVPAHAIGGWRIAASHSDSPTWRIKNTNVNAAGCIKLNVEGYGGMIMSTWLDRPLSAAGRVLVRDEAAGTLESRLVNLDRDLLVIPSLAIHMDRTLNSGHAFNPQVDMQPLYGLEGSKPFPALLAEAAGVKEEDIVDFDLSLYTRQAPTRIGPDGELFMAPRIDDLECAATTLYGFWTPHLRPIALAPRSGRCLITKKWAAAPARAQTAAFARCARPHPECDPPQCPGTGPGICQQLCAQRR